MKKLFSLAFFLGIVLTSMLAFAKESDSPPDVGEMELRETPVINSAAVSVSDLLNMDQVHIPYVIDLHVASLAYECSLTSFYAPTSSNEMYTVSHVKKMYLNQITEGRDVYVNNIGYNLSGKENALTLLKESTDTYLKLDGTANRHSRMNYCTIINVLI